MLADASAMFPRAIALAGVLRIAALRRLVLAALSLCVLGWTAGARAEEDGNSPGQKVAGMCGTAAQSIKAPPPIYPSEEAVAKPCAPPTEELRRGVPVLPTDGPATAQVEAQKSAVLPLVIPLPRRQATTEPWTTALATPGEEHRLRAKRPPRS